MILKAAWVVPVTSPPIRRGFVEFADGRIVSVGETTACGSKSEAAANLGDVVLTPGLVNPHTHFELSCYAHRLQPAPFWIWIEKLIRLRAEPGQQVREQQAVLDGAWQSLRAGVTCAGDISRRNVAWSVLKKLPIRKVCFVELLTLADHPPRNIDELRAGVQEVVEDERLTVGVTPHTSYTVPADQVRAALVLAAEIARPWTMHLAETREEVAFLAGEKGAISPMIERLLDQCGIRSPGKSPLAYLRECGEGLPRGALAHMNYVSDDEIGQLAALDHVVVYCPRAHRFFGHTPHPFMRMRNEGVTVAVGTDSLASNTSLSLLDELNYVLTRLPDPPSPAELLRMATVDAAHALDLADRIGSLEADKWADLAAFPCSPDATDPVRALIERPVSPSGVWVAGERVV